MPLPALTMDGERAIRKFARDLQLTADRLERFALNKIRPTNLRDRFHNQHPELGSR